MHRSDHRDNPEKPDPQTIFHHPDSPWPDGQLALPVLHIGAEALRVQGFQMSAQPCPAPVEVMIAKDFIKNVSLLGVDAGDIKAIKENSDFLDGCKKYCYAKEMKVCLQTAIDNMSKAHADAKLAHLGVKLLLNKESELMLDEISTLGDVFNNLEGVEVVWGIGKNDSPQNGKIAICVVGGFMNN